MESSILVSFGSEIKGECKIKEYADYVEIHGYSFGIYNPSAMGSHSSVKYNQPVPSEVSFSKNFDKSSVKLTEYLHSGKPIEKVEMVKIHRTETGATEYLKISLTDVHLSSLNISMNTDSGAESWSMSYKSLEMTADVDGNKEITGFNYVEGSKL